MKKRAMTWALCLAQATVWLACDFGVNENIAVPDGETRQVSLNTVNGNIAIGQGCRVQDCRTVNGRIAVDRDSETANLQAANGKIDLGKHVVVHGNIETLNGSVVLGSGSSVDGSVTTINGKVTLHSAVVNENVETGFGNIILLGASRIKNDVRVQGRDADGGELLIIRLAEGSVVEGDIIVEDKNRRVELHLIAGGRVLGKVKGVAAIKEHTTTPEDE